MRRTSHSQTCNKATVRGEQGVVRFNERENIGRKGVEGKLNLDLLVKFWIYTGLLTGKQGHGSS